MRHWSAWPYDGTRIMPLGDGMDYREQAQNPANHLGSIVRCNADGSVPDDNPFMESDAAEGASEAPRPEIYSYGHRNVQGLVVDDEKRIIVHEPGPRGGGEINLITPGTQPPLYQWTPSIAPSDMTFHDGARFPEWQGNLWVGAFWRAGRAHPRRAHRPGRRRVSADRQHRGAGVEGGGGGRRTGNIAGRLMECCPFKLQANRPANPWHFLRLCLKSACARS